MNVATVKQTGEHGKVRCGSCGRRVTAVYQAQAPAPCGCVWTWAEGAQAPGVLEAEVPRWWLCDCGEYLPDAPEAGRGLVQCAKCGDWWRFDHWALNRWPDDRGVTALQPRRAVMHKSA